MPELRIVLETKAVIATERATMASPMRAYMMTFLAFSSLVASPAEVIYWIPP